ncbi:MAG: AMP-binding protein [Pseudomonadales bacterium]
MYPGKYAEQHPDRTAFVMASSGESVSYAEYEARCNQLAHLLRSIGLQRLDHYAIFMENHPRYLETCGAGERAGLYYTAINSYLTADELAYILDNCDAKVLITSKAKADVARAALASCPKIKMALLVDAEGDDTFVDYRAAIAEFPTAPIEDEALGAAMLYSSGTTGRPKGILRPLPESPPGEQLPVFTLIGNMWRYREGMTYLSPAPLYHSAPQAAVALTLRYGGTAVIMEHFDPEDYLELIGRHKITHSQLVPTMFSRMLKLPEDVRAGADLSSLEFVVHAAAPCPAQVKEQMIEWWGPIIHEYYGATEAFGFTFCDTAEWLAHRGTVGKVIAGTLHILDEDGKPSPKGEPGEIWFERASDFEYYNDPEKTKESSSADGTMATVGDVGYVDDDGFLHLTDRSTFMIISGGVNIYPQECEDLLITHPKVADAAVFGVPNQDLGEEVKAVIQPMPDVTPDDALAEELIAFCHENLARQKCPRSIDFEAELPRLPTGKLYKRHLRDRYWGDRKSRIL